MFDLIFFKKKSILIPGGTGYIGSKLASILKPNCKNLTIWDRSINLQDPLVWKNQLPKTDLIFYLAAQTSSEYANEHSLDDASINVLPITTLIEVCTHEKWRPDIIFASTVTAVGLTKTVPVDESWPDQPITIYDIHKLTAEKYLYYYANILKGKAGILRLANVYGPSQAQSKASDRGIVSYFVKQALQGHPITLYGGGEFMRDYIYLDDVVNAFILAAKHAQKLAGNYYVIGSGQGYTIKQMAQTIIDQIQKVIEKQVVIKLIPPPEDLSPIESRHFVANSSLFKEITGWSAQTSLSEGIEKTVRHLL